MNFNTQIENFWTRMLLKLLTMQLIHFRQIISVINSIVNIYELYISAPKFFFGDF